ncbi:MAG: zinc ribbon domain-containing protein [Dehalococcoidia bacterium]|nr:zinc ribbon domain-containing protein [Dehalococcoidia bacterium]
MKVLRAGIRCTAGIISRRRLIALASLAALVATAVWASPAATAAPAAQESPRLQSLDIDLWPEYDRPAMLVILHAALPQDAALPADLSLRIPATSGGPSAVASAETEGGRLINLDYETVEEGDALALKITTPDRFVQIEFYDALATNTADRSYTYVWPGDLAVDELTVRVQEPLGAAGLSVEPDIGAGTLDQDGFAYRSASLGAMESGRTLSISTKYQKSDPRTSLEILNAAREADSGAPVWLLPLTVAVLVVTAAGVAVYWRSRHQPEPLPLETGRASRRAAARRARAQRQASSGFCTQCGRALREGSRFCSRCGAPARAG